MKKLAILFVVALLALATLACSALTPAAATAVPIFAPAATEVRPPTATPEPSPTPLPLEVRVTGVEVYESWEDADQKYDTPAGDVWLAVELKVLAGDSDAAIEEWIRNDEFPIILGDGGIELSDGTLVYVLEDGTLVLVFPVPSDASTEGLLLVFPDGSEYPLEGFFQMDDASSGPQA